MLLRFPKFLVFLLIIIALFPSYIEASSKNDLTPFDYLQHVELAISTSDDENSIVLSNGTIYEDSKRTIFQSFQLPHYNLKWHIHQFNYPAAWSYVAIRPIKIAIIDTGSSIRQLADPRFKNGRNFINPLQRPIDDNGHGSALASVTLDVVGPYPVEIIPIKAADRTGSFTISNIVKAIDYAIEQQVDVINLSFGAKEPHELEQQAVNQAIEAGIAVFSSSGNTGRREYFYPAAYPNVISVGAITSKLKRASFSTYNNGLDFVAPGANLYVDSMEGADTLDGTSFATAYFAGQYAILKANSFEMGTGMGSLPHLATDLGVAGWDHEYGHGMIEVDKVLETIRGKAWKTVTIMERKKTWSIRLNKEIKHDQAFERHVKLYDATLIEQPIRIEAFDAQTIKLTPAFDLQAGEYWLVITLGLGAKNGQQLKQPAVMKFIVQ